MNHGSVIWITGLSGAGKSYLCEALFALAKPAIPHLVILDGDVVRAASGNDLGHGEADRTIQFGRLHGLARELARQGLVVVVAAVYCNQALLDKNRRDLPGYAEVYLKASLDLVKRRDSKGLYAKALSKQIRNVVGIDIPAHVPDHPDLVLDADAGNTPEDLALLVSRLLPVTVSVPNEKRTFHHR